MRAAHRQSQRHLKRDPQVPQRQSPLGLLVAFILTCALFVLVGSGVLRQTAFRADYMAQAISDTDAAQVMTKRANQEAVAVAAKYHIPSAAVNHLITRKAVTQDLAQTIQNIYADQNDPVSTQHIMAQVQQQLATAIKQSLPGLIGTETVVNTIVSQLTSQYQDLLQIPAVTKGESQLQHYRQLVERAFSASIVIVIVFTLILIFVDHRLGMMLWHFGWAGFWSGGLLLLTQFIVKLSGVINVITIAAKSFQATAAQLATTILNSFFVPSLVLLSAGVVCILMGTIIKHTIKI